MKEVEEVLAHYSLDRVSVISPITTGLIHATYHVHTNGGEYILQRLKLPFNETTVADMEQVALHLTRKGVVAPRVIHTTTDASFQGDLQGNIWRLMTYIEGEVHQLLPADSYAAEASKVLAEFHVAMEDFDVHMLKSKPMLHQTQKFYSAFCNVYDELMKGELDQDQRHSYEYIRETLPSRMLPADLPTTVIHADPKLSNVIFRGTRGICFIDLDTCMRHTPLVDLGDALRWCAISEEAFPNSVSISQFAYTMQGYESVNPLPSEIKRYVPQAFSMVVLGIAARFARDVHDDSYFGWNDKKYSSRREHNKARARSMVSLARDILRKEEKLQNVLEK